MRSRTELVTTTFIDSEDDFTETDDSEEDWRPSASNRNVKKRSHTTKGRNRGSRKRKSSGTSSNGTNHKKSQRQAAQDAIYQTYDDSDDEDEDDYEYYRARTQLAAEVEPKAIILPPKKKEKNLNGNSASGIFQLFLYRKDLKEDYVTNSHLCLWRKDGSNLLQKYIRVKTGVPDEFMFTSSSVYSTWDDKRRRDFVNITVKCHEENHRRVTFVNPSDLHSLARSELERVCPSMEEQVDNEESDDENEENDDDAELNSDASECDENNGSFQPEDEEAEVECDEDNIEEIEEDEDEEEEEEHASEDDDQVEEEFDEFEQLDEEDEEVEEDDDDDEDKENQYESEHD